MYLADILGELSEVDCMKAEVDIEGSHREMGLLRVKIKI